MPRYNGAQLARAAALGQELRASASFDNDDFWHAYQTQVQVALRPEKPLPAVGDPKRRTEWGSLAKAHKKMMAQLNADGATAIVACSSAASSSAAASSTAEVTTTAASMDT